MKRLMTLVLCLALSGCATKFAYNNLDWLLDSFVDDYIELDYRQDDSFDRSINKIQYWHKREELPRYIDQSQQLIELTNRKVTAQDIELQIDLFQQHWNRLMEVTEPELYQLSKTITPKQLSQFQKELEKDNQKYLKKVSKLTPNERIEERYERYEKWVEKWFGPLHSAQKKELRQLAREHLSSTEDWVELRRRWSAELTEVAKLDRNSEEFRKRFQELMLHPESLQTPEHKVKNEMNRQLWIGAMTNLMNSMTKPQRKHLANKLTGWQETFNDLQTRQSHDLPMGLTARILP